MGEMSREADVAVIGAGPGGYCAAFRAAELGLDTVLIDTRKKPGGVCLYEGCIPSKTLLSATQLLRSTKGASKFGIRFGNPEVDIQVMREWKNSVIKQLTDGLSMLSEKRGIEFIRGRATFENSSTVRLEESEYAKITFKHAILATGSRPLTFPGLDLKSSHVIGSRGALELEEVPKTLLVVGGGYIGLELGMVYATLGSAVTVVELTENLLPGVDRDLVRPLEKRVREMFKNIYLNTKVVEMKEVQSGIEVRMEGKEASKKETFEKVLVSVGRRPNSDNLGLEKTQVKLGSSGFVQIDPQCRTADKKIFAIGDVAGQPMLAHKAMREGKIAAEAIKGLPSAFDNQAIPAVVFTDPEVAWCGVMEAEAREKGHKVKVTRFPWAASGRAVSIGWTEGLTKMVFDESSGVLLGVGIVGPHAGDLIAEGVLAIEMGAVAEDLAATIHTHPTFSETMGEAAEMFLGYSTHIYKK